MKIKIPNKKRTVGIIALIIAMHIITGFIIYSFLPKNNTKDDKSQVVTKTETDTKTDEVIVDAKQAEYFLYDYQAVLKDITAGATFESIKFTGDSSGTAYAEFENGQYKLYADFKNLPTLPDNLFYEGWIISDTSGVISSGELTLENGLYINQFSDNRDLSDASQYVLTIEPRDGNPKPAAGHIVDVDFHKI